MLEVIINFIVNGVFQAFNDELIPIFQPILFQVLIKI